MTLATPVRRRAAFASGWSLPRVLVLFLTRPLREAIDASLQGLQGQQATLQPHRSQLDPEHLEHVVARQLLHLVERLSLDLLAQHRGRGLADRAADARESYRLDRAVSDLEVHPDLVSAQRIGILVA